MQNRPRFIEKNEWPPNSPDLNPLDCHVWDAILEKYYKLQPKPKTIDELKVTVTSGKLKSRFFVKIQW